MRFRFSLFLLKDSSLLCSPSGKRAHFTTSAANILPLSSWRTVWHANINSRAGQADLNSLWDSLKLQIATSLQRDDRKNRGRQRSANTPSGYTDLWKTWRTASAGWKTERGVLNNRTRHMLVLRGERKKKKEIQIHRLFQALTKKTPTVYPFLKMLSQLNFLAWS